MSWPDGVYLLDMTTPATQLNQETLAIAKTFRLPESMYDNPEYQKMVSGCDYQAWDKQLTRARAIAHDQIEDYNTMRIRDYKNVDEYTAAKAKAFDELVGASGKPGLVESPVRVDYGFNTKVGDNFYANFGLCILDCSLVVIGNNVMCAPNVTLCTATHPLNAKERLSGSEFSHPIFIEDNVWIGAGAIILPGVRVGRNSVVAAGAVVSRDVAPDTVVAGIPAKKIRDIDNTNLDLDEPALD